MILLKRYGAFHLSQGGSPINRRCLRALGINCIVRCCGFTSQARVTVPNCQVVCITAAHSDAWQVNPQTAQCTLYHAFPCIHCRTYKAWLVDDILRSTHTCLLVGLRHDVENVLKRMNLVRSKIDPSKASSRAAHTKYKYKKLNSKKKYLKIPKKYLKIPEKYLKIPEKYLKNMRRGLIKNW